jgi:hypothetical protein
VKAGAFSADAMVGASRRTRVARAWLDRRDGDHLPSQTVTPRTICSGTPERVAMQFTGHRTRSVFDRYNIVSTPLMGFDDVR